MGHALVGDGVGRVDLTPVADPQRLPVEPPDAPPAVPPGHPRAEGQLVERVRVGAGLLDLGRDLPQPHLHRPGRGHLGMVQPDELRRLSPVDPLAAALLVGSSPPRPHREFPSRIAGGRSGRRRRPSWRWPSPHRRCVVWSAATTPASRADPRGTTRPRPSAAHPGRGSHFLRLSPDLSSISVHLPPQSVKNPGSVRTRRSPGLISQAGASGSSRDRTRTYNLPVNSRLLCRLSYTGSCGAPLPALRLSLRRGTRLAHSGGGLSHPLIQALSRPGLDR